MKKTITIFCLLFTTSAFAQYTSPGSYPTYTPPPPVAPTTPMPIMATPAAPPNHIKYGDQYFDGSLSGLREYFDEYLMETNKKAYKKLNPKLKKLERNQRYAWAIGGVAVAGGLIYGLTGLGDIGNCDLLDSACEAREEEKSNNALLISSALIIGGGIAFYVLNPSRKDIMRVINRHNKINKKAPLKWQLGLTPAGESVIQIGMRF